MWIAVSYVKPLMAIGRNKILKSNNLLKVTEVILIFICCKVLLWGTVILNLQAGQILFK